MDVGQLKSKYEHHSQYDKISDLIDNALRNLKYEDSDNLSKEFVNGVNEFVSELNNFDSDLRI